MSEEKKNTGKEGTSFLSEGVSRQDFIKALGLGAAAIAGASMAPELAAQPKTPEGNPPALKDYIEGNKLPSKWNYTADVVVIGAGACGLPAAIRAAEAGASVIVVDTNYDIGGHAITSGGNVPLGGGTSLQKKYGIEDSPDQLFKDLTDWTVIESSGMPDYRYNDRGVQRALADNEAPTYEFLVAHGVPFQDKAPDNSGAHATGISAKREAHCVWTKGQSAESPAGAGGTELMRALESAARKLGIKFLLNYHMDVIYREKQTSGRVMGLMAHYSPTVLPGGKTPLASFRSDGNIASTAKNVTVRARKAVIIGTGGSTGNVNFRRMYDPRLTEEIPLAAGEYSPQDASGELAGLAVGASLWGTANQCMDRNGFLRKRPIIGTPTNYVAWKPQSPIWGKIKATGLNVRSWQDAILVNQAGKRYYNEMEDGYPNGTHEGSIKEYKQGDLRNRDAIKFNPPNYADACLAMNELSEAPDFGPGPQWAIFDADAVTREHWKLEEDSTLPGYFFKADTLAELAAAISGCPYQKKPMPAANLESTVARYNDMVAAGEDSDFAKPKPQFPIGKAPFYAAWATITVHDTYAGLRINMKCQVLDFNGQAIPGLFCGGESAGGCSQHGLARCLTEGYIAGGAAVEK